MTTKTEAQLATRNITNVGPMGSLKASATHQYLHRLTEMPPAIPYWPYCYKPVVHKCKTI